MSLRKKFPTLRWPGAKAHLAADILKYIPRRGRKFIDLFAGRANLTLRAIAEGFEYDEWMLNDILTAPFLRALRDHGDQFKATERSKAEHDRLAELAKQGDPHALLMEPYLCFNGGTFARGCSTTDGGHRTPKSYEDNVHLISKLFREKNVRISADDWWDCLQAEQLGPDDFVFIDFPYIGCDVGDYSPESICPTEIIEYLKAEPFKWVMTEYDQPLYLAAFGKPVFHRNVQLRTTNFAKTRGKDRRMECVWTNIGKDWAKRDGVTFQPTPVPDDRTDTYYVGLPLDEILREINECVAVITAARNQMNAEMRKRLLHALRELKKLTFRKKPGFYETLAAMGLNPDTVRQWFYRSNTADRVIALLEVETVDRPNSGGSGDETHQGAKSLPLDQVDNLPEAHDPAPSVSVTPEFLPPPNAGESVSEPNAEILEELRQRIGGLADPDEIKAALEMFIADRLKPSLEHQDYPANRSELARLRNDGRWHGFGSEWATDPVLFAELDREFHFTLDPCASDLNHKCPIYFTEKENGLIQDWGKHSVYVNAPYGEALYEWMKKAYESSLLGARVVCLVPAATDTAWFHEFASKGKIYALRGRQWFFDPEGERHQPYSPSMLVVFAPTCPLKTLYAFDIQGPITPEMEAYIATFKFKTLYERLNYASVNDNSQHDAGTEL